MRDGLSVAAPCKINLHLGVYDRRSDGYHPIESIFQLIGFGDVLWIDSLKKGSGIELCVEGPISLDSSVPPEQNIVYKAVSLFQSASGDDSGWHVRLEKRVPLGAGLGGGSSDAAAVLLALNRLTGYPLSEQQLEHVAAKLGSDVPFFIKCGIVERDASDDGSMSLCGALSGECPGRTANTGSVCAGGTAYGGTAYVTGRGEHIELIDVLAPWCVILVNPALHSSTPEAFAMLDRFRQKNGTQAKPMLGKDRLACSLSNHPSTWTFYNDFLEVFMEIGKPEVRHIYSAVLRDLKALGADFANLSGSGSTCYGVFSEIESAKNACRTLLNRWPFVELTFPLARRGNAVVQ